MYWCIYRSYYWFISMGHHWIDVALLRIHSVDTYSIEYILCRFVFQPDYRDMLLWYLEYGVCFCRQVLLTCTYAFVVLKIKISWFLIPGLASLSQRTKMLPLFTHVYAINFRKCTDLRCRHTRWHILPWFCCWSATNMTAHRGIHNCSNPNLHHAGSLAIRTPVMEQI